MKVKSILIAIGFLMVSLVLTSLILLSNSKFYLEDEYYGDTKMEEIDSSKLNRLIATSESFALFVYQPMCVNSTNFEAVLTSFQNENKVSIKKITFSNLKGTSLEEKIKYYPSFVIFKNGEVIDYLETDNDDDTVAFKTKKGFYDWFTKYVSIKKTGSTYTDVPTESSNVIDEIKIDLPDVKKEKGKVNIYFFWGDGCPHCEHEQEFFDSIEKEYGDLYNLYKFETWNNRYNANMMKVFSKEMGDGEKGGVPYTIIGSKTFRGFGSSSENKFKEAIEEEASKDFDIYIDVIKDNYKK